MQGALLRSGKSESFAALGETGQPVYRAALQLREAIRRKHPALVDHLAIPQSDELGNKIDWYSGVQGDVIPWSAATEEERAPARQQLEALKEALNELSSRFLASDPIAQQGDKAVFGKLLKRVIHFPDEDFVYLVNGKPVLTFWGFEHTNADRNRDPLRCLYPPAALPNLNLPPEPAVLSPAEPAPTVWVRRPWWRRWWWLLPLLLLLLLLLLLGLRGCVPSLGLPKVDVPAISVPSTDAPSSNAGLGMPNLNATGSSSTGLAPGATGVPAIQDQPAAPAVPAPSTEKPELAAPPKSSAQREEPATEPAKPDNAAAQKAAPLSIPSNAANGVADFLNGHYRAGAGIQDRRTGNPLRLEYQFKDGKGEVTVRQPNGVSCSGPVAAAMNNGNLSISSGAQAACGDGSTYDMPKIECANGAKSIADCTGGYGAEKFPMSMRQMAE
jgi:hypothetical protein